MKTIKNGAKIFGIVLGQGQKIQYRGSTYKVVGQDLVEVESGDNLPTDEKTVEVAAKCANCKFETCQCSSSKCQNCDEENCKCEPIGCPTCIDGVCQCQTSIQKGEDLEEIENQTVENQTEEATAPIEEKPKKKSTKKGKA